MALYQYKALDALGRKKSGLIDADSLEAAKDRLRKSNVIVTRIVKSKSGVNTFTLSRSALLNFTRDVSQLLRSGLPLYESLLTIEEKHRGHKSHPLFLEICDLVKQGTPLSKALERYPGSFDHIYVAMIRAGESTGGLDHVFIELAKIIARGDKFRKQVRAAMVYPSFLGLFCLLILSALFLFLIPSMKELYEGRSLHPLTQGILSFSSFFEQNIHIVGIGFTLTVLSGYALLRSQRFKSVCKVFFLRLPFFKSLITEAVLMRFSRALSVLIAHGIPTLEALRLSKGIMDHASFENVISRVEESLTSGKQISDELKKSSIIPPLMTRMVATAEEAGNLSEMLTHITEIYEEELDKNLSQLTNLLQPLMLLILGALVGLVLLSVLLPLTDVSSFI